METVTEKACASTLLKVAHIITTAGTQIRARMDVDTVSQYAELMQDSTNRFPPVVVFCDRGQYILADGFHRVWAAHRNSFLDIEAIVHKGTKADALRYALGANAAHGLRRSNADKRRSVELALAEWPTLSDREIERICCVSDSLVADVRKAQLPDSGSCESEKRTGKDGKLRKLPARHAPIPALDIEATTSTAQEPPQADAAADPEPSARLTCDECGETFDDDSEAERLFECDQCGDRFTSSGSADGDGHRCPSCNKFGRKVTDLGCPSCGQGELQEAEPDDRPQVIAHVEVMKEEPRFVPAPGNQLCLSGTIRRIRYVAVIAHATQVGFCHVTIMSGDSDGDNGFGLLEFTTKPIRADRVQHLLEYTFRAPSSEWQADLKAEEIEHEEPWKFNELAYHSYQDYIDRAVLGKGRTAP